MTIRRLAAILAADVVGFSRLIGEDEAGTLEALREIRSQIVNPLLKEHGGRIFKLMGDGMLAEFPSAVQALRAAVDMQERMQARNGGHREDRPIQLRIGLHQGDVVVEGSDLLGDGVNVAARLEALAEPGGICISGRVHEDAAGKIALEAEDIGEQSLKNIARTVRVYRVSVGLPVTEPKDFGRPALPLPDKPSVAVLPFQNMSGDPEQEYFADGVVEEIITALSRFRQLFVIARNSSFTYKGNIVDLKQVGRELGVRYILEGSVRKAGGRVRIAAQLIDASTGNHLWADRFDDELEEIFDLQDKIAVSVVGAIEPRLRQAEIERARHKRPESLGAYDCVMRAMPAFWSADAQARKDALFLLERAMAIDPGYALPKALAAWCHAQNVAYHGRSTLQERSEAIRLAEEAAKLDSEDPMVLTVLAAAYSIGRRVSEASPLIEKALLLNPNSAWTWQRSGWVKHFLGEYELAIDHFKRSIRISPLDVLNFNAFFGIGCAHFGKERYQDAVVWLRKAISARASATFVYRVLASALAHLGELDGARQAVATFRSAHPEVTISKIVAGLPMNPQDYVDRLCEGMRRAGLPE
ncbi:MAG: hypothetical protein JO094_11360 [Hyphomicrobiales bacterium]|nr:hypothetical protein [Hyphomicrobiales bacterium]